MLSDAYHGLTEMANATMNKSETLKLELFPFKWKFMYSYKIPFHTMGILHRGNISLILIERALLKADCEKAVKVCVGSVKTKTNKTHNPTS